MHHGDNQIALMVAETLQLPEEIVELCDVIQDQATKYALKGGTLQRQRPGHVMLQEGDRLGARLAARALEHRLGEIDRRDTSASCREPNSMAPSAAPEIGRAHV